ncbi:hypothetical protein IFM89_006165 [Coptis chinensis]|uniref:Receptor ligand binding region domain-containing protein n=1 Tax=Coptis chinensis TaxID=261450 RepID=A0A835GUQ7_9MAGN|nr:hypothetical protein IFM89_006165 [Coptis chinensis]
MSAPFGVKFFLKEKDLGMMNEGYVWILTNGLMNVLDVLEPTILDSMQGALGVVPYIARSEKLDNFNTRWKRESFIGKEMINFGLWAYDTIWALAMAAERVGDMKPNSLRLESDGNFIDVLGVSQTGPKLLEEILKIKFEGLSGEFHVVNGQLQPSAFLILNVVGESTTVPKDWAIPMNGKKLKIGVPVPEGFSELVNVEKDPYTNSTRVSGYCIDVFKSAIESLPYTLPYEFVPFQREDGKSAGSYNDLIYQVHLKLKKHGGLPVQRFLTNIRLENWANAYFHGARYGEMCSTLAECFNAWITKEHFLPITPMLFGIMEKMMEMSWNRLEESMKWNSVLCPQIEIVLASKDFEGG